MKSGRLDLNQRRPAPKQVTTLTNYYILPDFRGKPGVGAGVSRYHCRTLLEETHPQTHPVVFCFEAVTLDAAERKRSASRRGG
jgi:hypothetical protein